MEPRFGDRLEPRYNEMPGLWKMFWLIRGYVTLYTPYYPTGLFLISKFPALSWKTTSVETASCFFSDFKQSKECSEMGKRWRRYNLQWMREAVLHDHKKGLFQGSKGRSNLYHIIYTVWNLLLFLANIFSFVFSIIVGIAGKHINTLTFPLWFNVCVHSQNYHDTFLFG